MQFYFLILFNFETTKLRTAVQPVLRNNFWTDHILWNIFPQCAIVWLNLLFHHTSYYSTNQMHVKFEVIWSTVDLYCKFWRLKCLDDHHFQKIPSPHMFLWPITLYRKVILSTSKVFLVINPIQHGPQVKA